MYHLYVAGRASARSSREVCSFDCALSQGWTCAEGKVSSLTTRLFVLLDFGGERLHHLLAIGGEGEVVGSYRTLDLLNNSTEDIHYLCRISWMDGWRNWAAEDGLVREGKPSSFIWRALTVGGCTREK